MIARRGKAYSPEKKEQIRRMVASGSSNQEIADHFGISYSAACNAVQKYAKGVRRNRAAMPCNQDCEHCKFPDCIVPDYLL